MAKCVRMADKLKRYIHIRLLAVDKVMRINKHLINKINNVLKFKEFTPSVSLLTVIPNCIDLVWFGRPVPGKAGGLFSF